MRRENSTELTKDSASGRGHGFTSHPICGNVVLHGLLFTKQQRERMARESLTTNERHFLAPALQSSDKPPGMPGLVARATTPARYQMSHCRRDRKLPRHREIVATRAIARALRL